MPYARRYKKRPVRRAPKTQEKKVRKIVKSELKKEIELKHYDRISTGFMDNGSLTGVNPLTSIVRGTSPTNFIGNKIKVKSLRITGSFIAADTPYNVVRMLIIQDGSTTFAPTVSNMFTNAVYPLYSDYNVDTRDQYRVLYDKLFVLSNDGVSTANHIPKFFKIKISGKSLRQVGFNASGNPDSGTIMILLVSDSASATHPNFVMSLRTTFTDA